jgi:hypothetical protein
VKSLRRAIRLGGIVPSQVIAISKYYPTQHVPIIDARLAMALGKERFKTRHPRARQLEKVAR